MHWKALVRRMNRMGYIEQGLSNATPETESPGCINDFLFRVCIRDQKCSIIEDLKISLTKTQNVTFAEKPAFITLH